MTVLVAISDTHGQHRSIAHIPQGDILIHCGDIADDPEHYADFIPWFANKPHKHKVCVAGNHDFWLDPSHAKYRMDIALRMKAAGIHYLFHEMVEIDGLKIFGSPYVPNLVGWAFYDNNRDHYANVPPCDVLVTHAPVDGIRDGFGPRYTYHGGSKPLKRYTQRTPLQAHFFGHVHEQAGVSWVAKGPNTGYWALNAATCTQEYKPTNVPVVYDDEPLD